MKPPKPVPMKPCEWTEDEDGNWDTACGEKHTFFDGGPTDNKQQFCGYCGAPLREGPRRRTR